MQKDWKSFKLTTSKLQSNFSTTKVSNYFSIKDKTPQELKSNMVYEYKCSYDKSIQYFRFTLRTLVKRIKEHLKGKTAVSDHITNCNICKVEKITSK